MSNNRFLKIQIKSRFVWLLGVTKLPHSNTNFTWRHHAEKGVKVRNCVIKVWLIMRNILSSCVLHTNPIILLWTKWVLLTCLNLVQCASLTVWCRYSTTIWTRKLYLLSCVCLLLVAVENRFKLFILCRDAMFNVPPFFGWPLPPLSVGKR